MLNDSIVFGQQIIDEFLTRMKEELIAYLDSEDRNASGRSKASLQVVNVTNDSGQLVGGDWIEYVFKGRAPGKMPPLGNIIEWCNSRGIQRKYAWIIAKNIAELGTKLWRERRNVLDEIITQDKIDAFVDSIARIYTARVRTELTNLFNAA